MGQIVSTIGASAATIYSAMSCRFVLVTFVSENGNFDTIFTSQGDGGDSSQVIKTGAGLFQWLSPTAPADSWDTGTCIGYTQSALDAISDDYFELARVLAVVAVVLGCALFLWAFALACLSFGRRQIWLLAACQLLLVVLVALFFIIKQSGLCHNVGQDTTCQMDQGGMMAVAASILWAVGFLITVVFMKSPEKEREAKIEALAEKLADQKRKQAVEERICQEQKEQEALAARQMLTPPKVKRSTVSPETVSSVAEGRNGEMEVYIAGRLNRIGKILDEEESV